jgi:hypothetical protein
LRDCGPRRCGRWMCRREPGRFRTRRLGACAARRWVAQRSRRVQMAAASYWSTTRRQLLVNAGCGAAGQAKRGIVRQYIRTITARDRLLKTSNAPRTAISSIVSTTLPFRVRTQLRSSAAVATSREGHRSPRSGQEGQHQRGERERSKSFAQLQG